MLVSFPRLGKFSAMIWSNIPSGPLSFSLHPFSHPNNSDIFFFFSGHHYILGSFLHGLWVVFLSFPQLPSFPSTCPLDHLILFSASLTLAVTASNLDCISVIAFLQLAWLDLISTLRDSLLSFMLFWSPVINFIIPILNSIFDILFISILISSVSELCSFFCCEFLLLFILLREE